MSHVRIFDNPKGRWLRAGQYPPLGLAGAFANYVSSASYEGRISITNPQGDCAVQLLSSTNLPPGAQLRVDNDTSEVVLTWPVYAALGALDTSIPNANFELGAQDWLLGAGWEIGTWNWEYDGPDNDLQAYDGTKSAEYHAGFRGNSRIRSAHPRACAPATVINASCQVQQGPSAANHTGGWVTLQFLDASFVEIQLIEGNHVDSGNDAEWHLSTVTATAPVGTAYAVIGGEGYRRLESKPMWLDTFAWDLPAGVGVSVGTNGTATVTLTLRVTDAMGRTVDGTYIVAAQPSVAAGILADLTFWFDFNGSLANSVDPTAPMGAEFAGPTYQAGFGGTQEMKLGSTLHANLNDGPVGDRCVFAFVNVVGAAATPRLIFGYTADINFGGYKQYVAVTGSGAALSGVLNDNSTVDFASGATTPGNRYFASLDVTAEDATAEFFIGTTSQGGIGPMASTWPTGFIGVHSNTGSSSDGTTDYISRLGGMNRKLTAAERAYLATGPTYADIVAAA